MLFTDILTELIVDQGAIFTNLTSYLSTKYLFVLFWLQLYYNNSLAVRLTLKESRGNLKNNYVQTKYTVSELEIYSDLSKNKVK